jgi:8-oxo-dGTP diphosphatase
MSRTASGGGGVEVRAAGGVVVRGEGAECRLLLIHRPRYDDWSLPKGKLESDESWEQGALREVEEETGLRCELGRPLEPARYCDHKGREKEVRWWLMRPLDGEFSPGDEVDEVRWLTPPEALDLLDYEHDRILVRSLDV